MVKDGTEEYIKRCLIPSNRAMNYNYVKITVISSIELTTSQSEVTLARTSFFYFFRSVCVSEMICQVLPQLQRVKESLSLQTHTSEAKTVFTTA